MRESDHTHTHTHTHTLRDKHTQGRVNEVVNGAGWMSREPVASWEVECYRLSTSTEAAL